MHQIRVHIKQNEQDDKQEIDSLARSLQDDLLNLDVEDVRLLYETPPPDSKAFDGVALGSMVVDFVSYGAIKEVTQTVQAWITRNENRSVTIEMADGKRIDVKGTSGKDQQKILVAGSTKIQSNYEEISTLAKMIGAKIMHVDNWILLNGGASERSSEGIISVDHLVCIGAQDELRNSGQKVEDRILTLHPERVDKNLHNIGKVEIVKETTRPLRRIELVEQADAIITIEGNIGTQDIIERGFRLQKLVLPIACTGGKSWEAWDHWEKDILQNFGIKKQSEEYEMFITKGLKSPSGLSDLVIRIIDVKFKLSPDDLRVAREMEIEKLSREHGALPIPEAYRLERRRVYYSQIDEQILERYPYAIFPSKVALGDVKPLRVIIKSKESELVPSSSVSQASGKIEIISKDEKEVSLLVVVDPENPHFEIQGDYYKEIIVPMAKEDSNPFTFDLKAKKEGAATIKLEFFQEGNYLGQLILLTNVVLTKLQADITSTQSIAQDFELMADMMQDSLGVTLIIFQTESHPAGKYDIIFYSKWYGVIPAGSISLTYDPESKFHHIFEDIENTNLSANEIEDRISDKGLSLYDELIPPALQKLYWEVRDDIKSIQVYSKEPWIPWEIIKPWRKLDNGEPQEDEFLCERFIFSRWLIGTKIEKKEKIGKAKVIVPADSKLDSALAERDWLTRFLDSKEIHVSVDSSYEEVKNTLKTKEHDLIHISSHGKHANGMPIYSVIELEDGREIRPDSISGLATRFGASHPIVFLNSCQSGVQGFSLTGVQSWVTKILESGASAFVGTLWSVSDETALKFTQELYTELSKGIAIGEAIRTARKNCKKLGDPSWLAYQFYGQPNLKIAFNGEGEKENIV